MIEFILSNAQSLMTGLVALFGTGLGAWLLGRKEGRKREKDRRDAETLSAQERGRQALRAGRSSGKSADQRLRDNDGKW